MANLDVIKKMRMNRKIQKNTMEDMSVGIRTPLNTISGITEIALAAIENGQDIERLKAYLETIKKASDDMKAVLDEYFAEYQIQEEEDVYLEKPDEEEKERLKNCRILIVEDNDLNQMLLQEMLEMNGAIVSIANDGQEGFDLFSESIPGTYDLILMDLKMDRVDGYEATKMIRESAHPQAKSIPIIATTADYFTEAIHKAYAVGMNSYIGKPIQIEKLIAVAKKYLNF